MNNILLHPSLSEVLKENELLNEKLCAANKTIAQMKADSNDLIESNLDNLDLFNDNSTN